MNFKKEQIRDLKQIKASLMCEQNGAIKDTIFMHSKFSSMETVCERIDGMLIALGVSADELDDDTERHCEGSVRYE